MLLLRQQRQVTLTCGHTHPHPTKKIGDEVACRHCRPRRVYRSRLNDHTISPWRQIVEVGFF